MGFGDRTCECGSCGENHSPLCDDTGIPHMVLEVGQDAAVTGRMLDAIREGIAEGLRRLLDDQWALWGMTAIELISPVV